jgi:hypothetical protein
MSQSQDVTMVLKSIAHMKKKRPPTPDDGTLMDYILQSALESCQEVQLYSNNQVFAGQVVTYTDSDLYLRAVVIDGESQTTELALWYIRRDSISSLCFHHVAQSVDSLTELFKAA